jgi:hypothetical protein
MPAAGGGVSFYRTLAVNIKPDSFIAEGFPHPTVLGQLMGKFNQTLSYV